MLFAGYCLYLQHKILTTIKMDEINNIQLFLNTGEIHNGYHTEMSGNYMILHSKEIGNNIISVTKRMFEMGGIDKVEIAYTLEQRTDIPKELLTEERKEENNG